MQSTIDLDEVLGGPSPASERKLTVSLFRDVRGRSVSCRQMSLDELPGFLAQPSAPLKSGLPLLKLASFGTDASESGCLRQTVNMISIDGVEGDYDDGQISVDEAAALLRDAGLASLIYTSPSHCADRPRWRVLCPLSQSREPEQRVHLVRYLNKVLGGILAPESLVQAQAFYFGRCVAGSPVETRLIEGAFLDDVAPSTAPETGAEGGATLASASQEGKSPANDDAVDWDRIRSAITTIPVKDADEAETGGRELYLRIGQALHHASGGQSIGQDIWIEWAKGGVKFNSRDLSTDWRSFSRRQAARPITIASLFDLAARRYEWQDPARIITSDDFDPLPDKDVEPARLRFLTPGECADAPPRGYIVKGLLAPRDLACIFGAPGAGKSMIAPHIGYQLALGKPAFGMRAKPGTVFYVAAEDPHGMRSRIQALRIRHGDAARFRLVEGVSDLFSPGAEDMAALREAVDRDRPSLIVIDTLAMAFPGLEENAAEAMNRVVSLGRKLTSYGAAVVLVHHDTKAQGPTPRGHSALNGALDVALQLFAKDELGIVRGRLTKNRNGSCERDIAFRISTERLGEDEDGDAITAGIVEELTASAFPKAEKLTASEQAALSVLDELEARGEVAEDAWRVACVEGRTVSAADDRKSRQTTTRRAMEGLMRKGRVQFVAGIVQRPGSVPRAFDEA